MRNDPGLVVVANRVPLQRLGRAVGARWERSPGGLVSAMLPALEHGGRAWVGWTGAAGKAPPPFEHEGIQIRPVSLSAAEFKTYYEGFSNRTLWPLFHDAIRPPEFRREWWLPYVQINQRFARAAASVARRGDLVWVHDYHLLLAPRMLRELRPDLRIGFFLHIPFPAEELFAWLPWRKPLLEGMLGADVVGFQTHDGARNFSRVAREYTDADGTDALLRYGDRDVRVGSFPISIDFGWYEGRAADPRIRRQSARIRERVGPGRRIVLAVDRLDYTKGIDVRLSAFEDVLRRGSVGTDKCVLIQIAVPSRELVLEYQQMRQRVEQLVGRINGQFSDPGQVAVHYFRRALTSEELVAYYLAADVMWVTPLRDGMNLVAKEYVATRVDHSGVLILSEFAGAARELRRALLVNPHDVDGMAGTLEAALSLSPREASQRMAILRTIVRRHDVHEWATSFLTALQS